MPKKSFITKITARASLSLCLLLAFLPNLSMAANNNISIAPYLDFNYSGNIFWDSSAVSDSTFSPGLELNFASRQFNLFLTADGKIYRSNDYLNQSTIYGGFNFYKVLSARSTFFLSPDFSLTQFKGDMSYLNTAIPSLAVGLKHIFSTQLYSRISLNLRHSNYLEENSYDRLRMAAFWEMSAFFKTQTTLRLTLGMNYLFFPHIFTEMPAATVASDPHHRRGNPNPPTPVPPTPPTPPDPPNPQPEPQISTVPATIALSIPQPFFVFRVAQGLGYKTGLIAEIQIRKNPNRVQSFDALVIDEWALQQMDADFFWQGTRLSLAFRTEAILKMEIAMDFSFFLKQYDGMEALDMDGVPILSQAFREDRLSQVSLKIAKSFGNFGFYITGSYRKNLSNDLYFRYGFYTISTGLDYVM
ncbi:MAG TPA: hypothetical protein VMZ49_01635 [Patescibacteria group bacterium]|nr:hypothetical protein [Patescibacteria group bacterium]